MRPLALSVNKCTVRWFHSNPRETFLFFVISPIFWGFRTSIFFHWLFLGSKGCFCMVFMWLARTHWAKPNFGILHTPENYREKYRENLDGFNKQTSFTTGCCWLQVLLLRGETSRGKFKDFKGLFTLRLGVKSESNFHQEKPMKIRKPILR